MGGGGRARRSARGTLIDCFRDRVMFAVRDERGRIAGFIGRARPDAGAEAPKYLNSPQTPLYRKGELLLGLHEGRGLLERGARQRHTRGVAVAAAVEDRDQALRREGQCVVADQPVALMDGEGLAG